MKNDATTDAKKYAVGEYILFPTSRSKIGLAIGIYKSCAIDIMINVSLAA